MNNPIGKYLVHSYLYYHLHTSRISDGEYDDLAKYILEHWDDLEHPHKHLLSKDMLEAGTCLIKEYPQIVKDTAMMVKSGDLTDEKPKEMFSSLDTFFS